MMASGGLIMGLDVAGRTGVAEGIAGSVPRLYSELFKLEDDTSPLQAYGRAIAWMAKRCARDDAPVAVYVEGIVPDVFLKGETHHNAQMIKTGLYACLTGVAMAKRHTKKRGNQSGRIVERPMPIDASNVVKV